MTINVTADDILNGVPGQPKQSPIALAVNRTTGGVSAFVNGDIDLHVDPALNPQWADGTAYESALPTLRQFAQDFDAGNTVQPFSFELDMTF